MKRWSDPKIAHKPSFIGAPAIFRLEQACQQINAAFGEGWGCYLVGSALERPDWRDVDVRLIMSDEDFQKLFPDAAIHSAAWECNPRWLLLTVSISAWLKEQTGLPVDFQFPTAILRQLSPQKTTQRARDGRMHYRMTAPVMTETGWPPFLRVFGLEINVEGKSHIPRDWRLLRWLQRFDWTDGFDEVVAQGCTTPTSVVLVPSS